MISSAADRLLRLLPGRGRAPLILAALGALLTLPTPALASWPLSTIDPFSDAPLRSPQPGSFRLSLGYQSGSAETIGPDLVRHVDGGNVQTVLQHSLRGAFAVSPARHVTLLATVLYGSRHFGLTPEGGQTQTVDSSGVEAVTLGARIWVWRAKEDEGGVALEGGLRFAGDGWTLHFGDGSLVPLYGQPSDPSSAPILGVLWSRQQERWGADLVATGIFPLIDQRYIQGAHVLINGGADWRLGPLTLRAGLFADVGAHDRIYGVAAYYPDPGITRPVEGSGGLRIALAPAVRVKLGEGLAAEARVDVPVLVAFTTLRRWSPQLWANLSYTFERTPPRSTEIASTATPVWSDIPGSVGRIRSGSEEARWAGGQITGNRVDLARRSDGSWAGRLGDGVIDVTVSPGRIVGANCSLTLEQEGNRLRILGKVNDKLVRIELDNQELMIRTGVRSITQPRTGPNSYGDIGFEGDAILANPPEPQLVFALLALFG